jgi:hypothetical protein
MGLDIQILSVPRSVVLKATDARLGSRYDKNPGWQQVAYDRNNWDLHYKLTELYRRQGGAHYDFNNTTVRLYRRDLHLLRPAVVAQVIEHMKKGRVVYAESCF